MFKYSKVLYTIALKRILKKEHEKMSDIPINTIAYAALASLAIFTIIIARYTRKKKARKKLVQKISSRWGKNPLHFSENKTNSNVSSYYKNIADYEVIQY